MRQVFPRQKANNKPTLLRRLKGLRTTYVIQQTDMSQIGGQPVGQLVSQLVYHLDFPLNL